MEIVSIYYARMCLLYIIKLSWDSIYKSNECIHLHVETLRMHFIFFFNSTLFFPICVCVYMFNLWYFKQNYISYISENDPTKFFHHIFIKMVLQSVTDTCHDI